MVIARPNQARTWHPTWIYNSNCSLTLIVFCVPNLSRVFFFYKWSLFCVKTISSCCLAMFVYFIFGHIHKCMFFHSCSCQYDQCLLIKIQQMTHSMRKTVELNFQERERGKKLRNQHRHTHTQTKSVKDRRE